MQDDSTRSSRCTYHGDEGRGKLRRAVAGYLLCLRFTVHRVLAHVQVPMFSLPRGNGMQLGMMELRPLKHSTQKSPQDLLRLFEHGFQVWALASPLNLSA